MKLNNLIITLPEGYNFSERLTKYINSLEINHKVEVEYVKNMAAYGMANYFTIYLLKEYSNINDFEVSIAHELAHIELMEQEYNILYAEKNSSIDRIECGTELSNLLHHYYIYPKLRDVGIVSEYDTISAFMRKQYLQKYKWKWIDGNLHERASIIYSIMNDLVRINPHEKEKYRGLIKVEFLKVLSEIDTNFHVLNRDLKDKNSTNYKRMKNYLEAATRVIPFPMENKEWYTVENKDIINNSTKGFINEE